jgi:hypothetical protein
MTGINSRNFKVVDDSSRGLLLLCPYEHRFSLKIQYKESLKHFFLKKKSKKKNHKRCRDPASIFKTIPTFVSHTERRRKREEIFRRISNSFTLALKY